MASSLWLPAPTRTEPSAPVPKVSKQASVEIIVASSSSVKQDKKPGVQVAPSYEERCALARSSGDSRKAVFVPRSLKDFDDGGAFPEIHVAQYPRNMGNPHLKTQSTDLVKGTARVEHHQVLNLEIDSQGKVNYDAVVTRGSNASRKVYSKLADLKGGDPDNVDLPTAEEEAAAAERTRQALQSLLDTKISADKPSGSALANVETNLNVEAKTQFIHYTPNPNAPGYNAETASQRVIQMVPAQLDPMMPPKHKHRKEPRGPAEDPVPVLHAPPKKLTKEEAAAWNVPACISNWKNTRGYTIPLDKRLAADGRGVRDTTTINPKFATLAESLYVAERQARDEVRLRANLQHQLELQQKEAREQELRQLAMQARMERSGTALATDADTEADTAQDNHVETPPVSDDEAPLHRQHKYHAASSDEDDNDDVARQQRDLLRMEKKRERERELRMEKLKKPRLGDDDDRDVSEKVALGVHTGQGGGGQVDTRLYNQSAGLSSGFGPEDDYNAFDKPLWDRAAAASIYKPTVDPTAIDPEDQLNDLKTGVARKFAPSKGFAGAEGPVTSSKKTREAPVQFERGTGTV